nr:MAG TPA: hypothetical protein [Caudoviricetes sp.]
MANSPDRGAKRSPCWKQGWEKCLSERLNYV